MTDDSPPDSADDASTDRHAQDDSALRFPRREILASLASLGLVSTGAAADPGARVERSRGAWTVEVDGDRALRLDPARRITLEEDDFTGSGNVLFGHLNDIADGVAGATIGGGGVFDHDDGTTRGNAVQSHFGTIAGGIANAAGSADALDEGMWATIGGGFRNESRGTGATVAGGVSNEATGLRSAVGGGINNDAPGVAAAIGGGIGNEAAGKYAAVAGGGGNSATERYASVSGGRGNHATAGGATVGGGRKNAARGPQATVAGGYYNRAGGDGAVVPGGRGNEADGDYSFATGYRASTGDHDGAVVFGDSSETDFEATADDAAFFQMPVHARAFNTTSTRAAKTAIEPVEPASVLDRVRDLPISTWAFRDDDGDRHMGPTAEDFHDAFDLGSDRSHIASVDADGVALAAIQGLADRLEAATERVEELTDELDRKDDRIDELEGRLESIERRLEPDAQASP